jgi:hypothetical protein
MWSGTRWSHGVRHGEDRVYVEQVAAGPEGKVEAGERAKGLLHLC